MLWVVGAVLAVAVLGVGGYAVRGQVMTAQACAQLRALPALVHAHTGVGKVTVLGDSYASGDTLPKRSDAWPYLVPWDVTVNAVGGTGFTNPGACGDSPFSSRVRTVLDTHPQTLIIQGGLNDWQAKPADIEKAASSLLDRVKSVPRVVIVGPVDAPARPAAETVDQVLKRVAAAHHVQYVSTLGWHDQFGTPGLHLTVAGQREYATQLAAAIGSR